MVTINGKKTEIPDGTAVEQMLLDEGFVLQRIAVERNGEILPKASFASEKVQAGDVYEVVNFVGGG